MGGKGILERLADGPVVGDGGMIWTMEKRGFVRAGPWSSEGVLMFPEGILQLHREFVRAGADVVQTATFYSTDDRISLSSGDKTVSYSSKEINDAACKLARKAADENGCLVCGGISPTPSFQQGKDAQVVEAEFKKQVDVYREHDVDFVTCEFFGNIKEVEICAREMKKLNKPVAVSMRLGVMGDEDGISVEECAVRMAETGADIVAVNCCYDVNTALRVMKRMKAALSKADLHPYLACQPLGMFCPEVEDHPMGYMSLPEFPFAMEPRVMTRVEVHEYARAAYDLGIHYIGGCCGFEPHHVRSISQELQEERGIIPPVSDMAQPFGGEFFKRSVVSTLVGGDRCSREYWTNLNYGSGRPYNSALSKVIPETKFVRK